MKLIPFNAFLILSLSSPFLGKNPAHGGSSSNWADRLPELTDQVLVDISVVTSFSSALFLLLLY